MSQPIWTDLDNIVQVTVPWSVGRISAPAAWTLRQVIIWWPWLWGTAVIVLIVAIVVATIHIVTPSRISEWRQVLKGLRHRTPYNND